MWTGVFTVVGDVHADSKVVLTKNVKECFHTYTTWSTLKCCVDVELVQLTLKVTHVWCYECCDFIKDWRVAKLPVLVSIPETQDDAEDPASMRWRTDLGQACRHCGNSCQSPVHSQHHSLLVQEGSGLRHSFSIVRAVIISAKKCFFAWRCLFWVLFLPVDLLHLYYLLM